MKLVSNLKYGSANKMFHILSLDIFFLLLIFILLGTFFVKKSGLDIKLPVSEYSMSSFTEPNIVTLVGSGGNLLFFNEDKYTISELREIDTVKKDTKQVVIVADSKVEYGKIIEICNIVLGKGYRVSFATDFFND